MSKTLKELARDGSDLGLATTIRDSAHMIWLAGLGAFAKAQHEGSKLFDTLVKEGEVVQERARKAADDRITDINAAATGTWEKLEQVFEDRVARALRGLGVPTDQDVNALSERVAKLTVAVEKMSANMDQKSAKPAARPTKKPS
jgi:poly(hydroxyalkanoate) granule-associated protein